MEDSVYLFRDNINVDNNPYCILIDNKEIKKSPNGIFLVCNMQIVFSGIMSEFYKFCVSWV